MPQIYSTENSADILSTKGHITKVYSIKGVDLKICLDFLLGKECPDSKNSGVLKTANSEDFKTVN